MAEAGGSLPAPDPAASPKKRRAEPKMMRRGPGRPRTRPDKIRYMPGHIGGWSKARRIMSAVEAHEENGWTQTEAARYYGLAVGTVNRHVNARRREREGAEERSRQARVGIAEANAAIDGVDFSRAGLGAVGLNETRRVPPVGEFVRRYFGGLKCWNCVSPTGEPVRHEIPPFHDEIMERLTSVTEKRVLVNVPPEHSKTTNGTVFTSVYDIVRDPNIQMAVVSAGEDLAKDIVGQIQMFLEDPAIYEGAAGNLIDEWGPFNDGLVTWTQKQMVVAGRRSAEKEPTMRAFGINSKIYGRRLHRIVCDDIADLDNNDTPEKVDRQFRKVTSILDSRVGGNGRLHVIGTRVAANDVYSRLLGLEGYTVIRHPCILSYDEGRTLWPDHIDFAEALRRKGRTATPELFELIYQNSDMMTEGATFTREQLDRCHDERALGQLPSTPVTLIVGVDPAGHGKQAGFTAMVLLGVDSGGYRHLVDLVNVRSMSQPQMQAQIFDWVSRYRPRSLRYEAVALQSQIFETREFREHLSAFGTRMDQHRTNSKGGVAGKWDPHWGVETMSVSFHNQMVSLPWGDAKAKRMVGQLEEQLMRFPMDGAPTDLLMAYWIADTGCRLALERGSLQRFQNRRHFEAPPPEMLQRRMMHGRSGLVRRANGRDFAPGVRDRVPIRLANMDVDDRDMEAMFDAPA